MNTQKSLDNIEINSNTEHFSTAKIAHIKHGLKS